MAIPKQSSIWDESRNSSRVIPPPPESLDAALKASLAYRRSYPEHARWILDGHPNLTEAQHYERFGKQWKKGDL